MLAGGSAGGWSAGDTIALSLNTFYRVRGWEAATSSGCTANLNAASTAVAQTAGSGFAGLRVNRAAVTIRYFLVYALGGVP